MPKARHERVPLALAEAAALEHVPADDEREQRCAQTGKHDRRAVGAKSSKQFARGAGQVVGRCGGEQFYGAAPGPRIVTAVVGDLGVDEELLQGSGRHRSHRERSVGIGRSG